MGRPMVREFEAKMHIDLQAGVATQYGILLASPCTSLTVHLPVGSSRNGRSKGAAGRLSERVGASDATVKGRPGQCPRRSISMDQDHHGEEVQCSGMLR